MCCVQRTAVLIDQSFSQNKRLQGLGLRFSSTTRSGRGFLLAYHQTTGHGLCFRKKTSGSGTVGPAKRGSYVGAYIPISNFSAHSTSNMPKRKEDRPSEAHNTPAPKRARPAVPEYHATPSVRNDQGDIVWPAPAEQIQQARNIILEW